MENRSVLGVLCAALLCLLPGTAAAYDDVTTHPALTDEAVSLYNRLFPESPVSAEERSWMAAGSTEEDTVPRPVNHLYDPVHGTGWSGQRAGWAPDVLVRLASLLALVPDAPLPSVRWIGADAVQSAYSRYGGNLSWPSGLRAAERQDWKTAYRSLGASLHLLQDSGVPDHARDDTHVHHLVLFTGDAGSPFEDYAARYAPGSLGIANRIRISASDLPRYENPSAYLEDSARYAANSFFSKDTVADPAFPLPSVAREAGGVVYGKTQDGREVPLARRVRHLSLSGSASSSLVLGAGKDFEEIHEQQFWILAERAVVLGAAMVRDFREAHAAGTGDGEGRPFLSVAGEVARAVGAIRDVTSRALGLAGAQLARGYSWLVGSLPRVASAQPEQVVAQPVVKGPGEILQVPVRVAQQTVPPVKNVAKVAAQKPLKAEEPAPPARAACPAIGEGSLAISEVAWMGSLASPADEWVEVENRSSTSVQLAGWEIRSADGAIQARFSSGVLAPGGFALLERTDDGAVPEVHARATYTGGMPNAPPAGYGLTLGVAGCAAADVAKVGSTWPAGDAGDRRTMERGAGGSWQTSAEPGGTPGRKNSAGFMEKVEPEERATSTKAKVAKKKRETSSAEAPPPVAIDQGVVRISEVQLGGVDAGDEWVELYNAEERPVALAGWSLQYIPAGSSSVAQKRDFPEGATIPGRGFFLVARELSQSGVDGYRGSMPADLRHRSFSISGLGATLALVRSGERAVSSTSPEVADWFNYQSVPAGQSLERAAATPVECLDPLPRAPGEFLGNGCPLAQWHVRVNPEPQNAGSPQEPRALPEEQAPVELPLGVSASGTRWVQISWNLLGAALREDGVQDWVGFVLHGSAESPPESVSTDEGLATGLGDVLQLAFGACHGSEVEASFVTVPLSAEACTPGGLLSGSVRLGTWEDRVAWLRVSESAALAPGQEVFLARYRYAGGRAGEQVFERFGPSTPLVVSSRVGEAPGAPGSVEVFTRGLVVSARWTGSADPDGEDAGVTYEASLAASGESATWEPLGFATRFEREAAPGAYVLSVRAVDEQGNVSTSTELAFVLDEPPLPEQLVAQVAVPSGEYPVEFAGQLRLRAVALWVVPEGGAYCCSRVRADLVAGDGTVAASFGGSRRAVDGAGEVELEPGVVASLSAGQYALRITADQGSNSSHFWGLEGPGGIFHPYLRLVVDSP